jgi:hypothetical protein
MRPAHFRFPILKAKLSTLCLVLVILVACDDKCCYYPGKQPAAGCKTFGTGGGECGLTECVFIGVDATSMACATGDGGASPNFLQDVAHRGATATYAITTRTFGVPDVTNTFNIALSAGDKVFLGCGQVFAGPTTPSQDNYFKLVSYQMAASAVQASLKPARLSVNEVKETPKPTKVPPTKGLDVQACDQLCKQASGKCLFMAADSFITKEQQKGLAKLFTAVTKQGVQQIPQQTLLQFFGMASDPCSRSATDFKGATTGEFINTGKECSIALENSPSTGSSGNSWLTMPSKLAGTFKRDAGSVTMSFDPAGGEASLETEGNDGFSRRDFREVLGTPGRIVATTGDRCVDFRYSSSDKVK